MQDENNVGAVLPTVVLVETSDIDKAALKRWAEEKGFVKSLDVDSLLQHLDTACQLGQDIAAAKEVIYHNLCAHMHLPAR